MVAMREISREVGISPVRSDQLYKTTVASNSMELRHNRHRISDVLNDVPANHFIEFGIRERIWQIIKIMYDIGRGLRIDVHSDSARDFVCAATDVEHSALRQFVALANLGLSLDTLGRHRSSDR